MRHAALNHASASRPLDKGIDHALLARFVELHGELIAIDLTHFAVAEFDVKHALAEPKSGTRRGRAAIDDLAVNGHGAFAFKAALTRIGKALGIVLAPLCPSALPAGRAIGRGKRLDAVEAARGLTPAAFRLGHLDVRLRQFVDKAAWHSRIPKTMDTPVRGEVNAGAAARARKPDMGKPPLLFEAGAALLVERALMRQETFLPAR